MLDCEIKISQIGQIAIAVSEISAATDFYQHILGLPLLFEAPPGLAFFSCGSTRLMLTTLQGTKQDHHTSVIYYKVDDIEGYCSQIQEKGVSLERPPQMTAQMKDHELWIGFLRDPDDNLIGIMSEKSLPGH